MTDDLRRRSIGWAGTGRMGFAMARRLLRGGADVAVWNRTRDKAAPLAREGAVVVDGPADLAGRDIVFTMLSAPSDFVEVTLGAGGLLSGEAKPRILVDSTSIDEAASARVRAAAAGMGVAMLAAPVSGNGKVAAAGGLTFAVSGPRGAYDVVAPYLALIGRSSSWMGEGEAARVIKTCHNLFLGVVVQSLVEATVLAEKAGVPRHAFLAFLNDSVLGSAFSRYKTPALVKLDYAPTFTSRLLLKDFDIGLDAARERGVPMPTAAAAREVVQALVGSGRAEDDFAALIALQAAAAGLDLAPEDAEVSDGLSG